MSYFDNNDDILSLIQDFSNKVEHGGGLLFYDIDEWLDIIDFFFIEDNKSDLLKKAIELSSNQYALNADLIVRRAEFISFTNPDNAIFYLLNESNKLKDIKDKTLLAYQSSKILTKAGNYLKAIKITENCLKNEINEYICTLYAHQNIKLHKFNKANTYLLNALNISYNNYTKLKDIEIKSYGANDFMFSATVIPDDLLYAIAELCKEAPQYKDKFYAKVESFVEYEPQNLDYWEMLIEFYERCNEYEKALEACDFFLCIEPDDVDVIRRKYINYVYAGKTKERTKLLQKIALLLEKELLDDKLDTKIRLGLSDSLTATYLELINILFDEKKYKECIDVCNETITKNSVIPIFSSELGFTRINVYNTLSRAYFSLGDSDEAMKFALKSIEADNGNIGSRVNFAELLYLMGNIDEANHFYQDIYDIIQDDIANEKSKEEPNIYELEAQYAILSIVILSWATLLSNDDKMFALELLDGLSSEIFKQGYLPNLEDSLSSIIILYTKLIFETNSPKEDLAELIQNSVIIYGNSFVKKLVSRILENKDTEVIENFEQIINELKNDEE
jgi:tetratricopeptide (TPR) repeat protein